MYSGGEHRTPRGLSIETKVSNSADCVAPTTFLDNSSRKKGKSQITACDTSYHNGKGVSVNSLLGKNEMIDA